MFFKPAPGHDHPFADGRNHQAVSVCIAGLFEHTVNISPHRGFGHIQLCGNLGVGFSLAEQAQGLHLAVGQLAGKSVAEPNRR